MGKNNSILQDISRLASSAFSGAVGMKREINTAVRAQLHEFMHGMNFVRREEFEVLHKLVMTNRKQIDALLESKHAKAKVVNNKGTDGVKDTASAAKKSANVSKMKKIKPVSIDR